MLYMDNMVIIKTTLLAFMSRPLISNYIWLLFAALTCVDLHAGTLRLEFAHESASAPFAWTRPTMPERAVTRLDYLVTGLALQRVDGSWLETSREWAAFISAETGQIGTEATGVPAEAFRAIRFRVGVDPKMNEADPNLVAPEHALHPDVNKLHWGWKGGYVFMALEGRDAADGFSYHIANDANAMTVELPAAFHGAQPTTLRIALNVDAILRGIDLAKDSSTHSRDNDPLAGVLKKKIESAFRVLDVKRDTFQDVVVPGKKAALPPGTTRFPLEFSQRLPRVELPADNIPTVQGVALGKTLFNDKHLSADNTISCASCHETASAFSDPRALSVGVGGKLGRRSSMPLFNLAWNKSFFWDGRATTLREQVLHPIRDPLEMASSPESLSPKLAAYDAQFDAAFGPGGATLERLALALEQYLFTLVSQDSKFDRAARNVEKLTDEESLGLRLFVTEHDPQKGMRGADCFHCHGGNLFTTGAFANNGVALRDNDLGRMEVTKLDADRGKFKAPSLRNIARTAPYMHDGRFATLEEVIDHYDHSVERTPTLDPNIAKHPATGLSLTAPEKKALVAFLRTLTDENFVAPPEQF